MPAAKITRDEAVGRVADVFRRRGYDGASLSAISEATGLGRASLYHHFPGGKEEMAREVFAHLGREAAAEMLAPLAGGGSPRQRLARWAAGVERFYARGGKNCLLGAMVLGGGAERFAPELAGSFGRLIDALATALREAGVRSPEARRRAENAIGRIQGALVVSRGLRDPALFRRVVAELPDELLAR